MTAEWRGPRWLKPFFQGADDTIFHRVTGVQLKDREVPDAVLKLRYLERLNLRGCRVSREQLERFSRNRSLKSFAHQETYVTEDVAIRPPVHGPATAALMGDPDSAGGWQWPRPPETSCMAFACPSDTRAVQ